MAKCLYSEKLPMWNLGCATFTSPWLGGVFFSSEKLTCSLKIDGWKMYSLLKRSLFRGHVSFRGCNLENHLGLV